MTTIVALPRFSIAPSSLERFILMIWKKFSSTDNILLLVNQEDKEKYFSRLSVLQKDFGWITEIASDLGSDNTLDNFIFIKANDESMPNFSAPVGTKKIYNIGKNARLHLTNDWLDNSVDPFVNHNVFNRCTPPTAEPLFSFAPYTYLFRYPGMGKYNQFGHRVENHLELANRDENHKVIAVFGGSACWSIFCYDDEVFTHHLEKKLNERMDVENTNLRFTVLNFGLPGNIVLNEEITYLLHCMHIKPDIVIAHDGFNDMFYGITSDSNMLRGNSIAYQFNLEEWAHTIQKDWYASTSQPINYKGKEHLIQPEWPLKVVNLPQDILLAYCQRKAQFKSIVEGQGANFIWGIQPYLHSKKAHSVEEQQYLAELSNDTTVRDVYRRIPFLYEKMKLVHENYTGETLVDFDAIFASIPAQETVFADYCHLTPAGDLILAESYFQYIFNNILPDMQK